jgi:phosphoserine phosphatase
MSIKRVIFMRPGETDWNRQNRWQGWVAAPLNAHGRRQVQALAKFVRNIGVGALYSSDLKRAEETAALLAEQLGYAPIFDERLRERNIGIWQGLTLDEMRAWYPGSYKGLLADVDGYQVPGGESRREVQKRMKAAFDDILKQDKGETVGIVSHTTAIRALLESLLPGHVSPETAVDNTSVTTITRQEDGEWHLVVMNDGAHLEGLETHAVGEIEDDSGGGQLR